MSGQYHRNAPGGQSGPPPNFPEANPSAPGYPGSYYPQGATSSGTAHSTAYGSRAPASPWVRPGMQMGGYDSSQAYQQSPAGQSPRAPPYSPRLANNESDPAYPLGFARRQGSEPMTPRSPFQGPAGGANAFDGPRLHQSPAPNPFRGSHPQQSVNHEPGFVRPPDLGPSRPPPQGRVGGANAFDGPRLRQSPTPNPFRGSHPQQSVNHEPGFVRPPDPGPNRPPPQGHVGGANAFDGPSLRQSAAPNPFRESHPQQSANHEPGFIRLPDPGPNRPPPQSHVGGANAFDEPRLRQSPAPNPFRGSHPQPSNNHEPDFIRPPDPGPNRPPPQGHGGVQNTPRGPHPAGRARKRKGLVIGTNYSTHPDRHFRLHSCVEDAFGMAHFINTRLGFARRDIRLMTDEADDPLNLPTKDNILAAMRALVHDAQPGDSFFFYFSGHGTQIKDLDGDEFDGFDECICAIDYCNNVPNPNPNTPGLIVDDVIHDILVRPLSRGCRLTALFDSCHSGTALDLPFQYDSHGLVKKIIHQDVLWLLRQKGSYADVVSLSASRDNQKARETRLGGALRCAFIECVGTTNRTLTYRQLLHLVREYMKERGFPQRPQLSTSYEIDTNIIFVT